MRLDSETFAGTVSAASLVGTTTVTVPEINIGTSAIIERVNHSGYHEIMIRGGAANGGAKASVYIGASTALADTEYLLVLVNSPSSGSTPVFGVRPVSGNVETIGKVLAATGIGVGNSAGASTTGTVVKKMEVFDASGASLGFVAIYDAIT